jgi:hypothetical protein
MAPHPFVFGKGLPDLLDDVFCMLPFSSIRQAEYVRTENSITEDLWNTSILAVAAEHSLPNARADLELLWKQRLISKGGAAAAAGASASQVTDQVEYEAESDH